MFSFNKSSRILALATILVLALAGAVMAYTSFTPQRTFTDTIIVDVGIPSVCQPPGGPGLTGWDIDEVALAYDRANDKLHVGISAYNAIVGDVDGDGDPGGTHACLSAAKGMDFANFESSESVDFIIDAGCDGTWETIVGMPIGQAITAFGVYTYDTTNPLQCKQPPVSGPGLCYGSAKGTGDWTNNPSTDAPDFEFVIHSFSGLLGLTSTDALTFCFVARAGALGTDAGFGEDITPSETVTFELGSIGDYVWNDADWEGDQDESNAGIPNITIALRDANGGLVALTETDSNGYYLFDNLVAGTYTVDVDENDTDMPDGYRLTSEATYGPDPMTVTLHPGEDYLDADFGYAADTSPLGGIGDYVWHDENGDTVQDPDEEGIGDITLTLYKWTGADWSYLDEMSTDHFGNYWFGGHEVGDYKVVVDDNDPDMPPGFYRTTELGSICLRLDLAPPEGPGSYQVDCGGFGGSARSAMQAGSGINLLQGDVQDFPYADYGYRGHYIGDYVWIDETGDGVQGEQWPGGPDEVGINGVDLELWLDNDSDGNISAGDTLLSTTTTANNPVDGNPGFYLFDGLSAGTYIVRIAPAEFDSGGTLYEYTATLPNQGTDDTVDSNGDNPDCPYPCGAGDSVWEDNILATVTLTNANNITIDFGVVYTGPPTAVTLSSFAATSSAGGSTNWLWLGLAGLMLTAGSLFWAKRRAG